MKHSVLHGRDFDVIVCGAGSAGVAAACSAAVAGARVLLLERLGFAGGIVTAAMIHTYDAIKSCVDNDRVVVGGFARRLLAEVESVGGMATADNPPEALTIHPEMLKVALDRLFERDRVTCLYHAHAGRPLMEGVTVRGVEADLCDGRAELRAPVVIDGTGEALIAHLAGAATDLAPDHQAMTYHFRLGGVDPKPDWREWEELTRRALDAAKAAGEIGVYGGPWIIRMAAGEISVNATRVAADPTDPRALAAAEAEGRRQMLQIWNLLRRRVLELKHSYILSGASNLHVRESRIIRGRYVLTEEDLRQGRRFHDSIAVGAWPVDIHPTDGLSGVHPHKERAFAPYEIPYRCLLPEAVEGLLVAGKPISTTHRAHGSTRVPGTSLATGQAAGVAAALAVKNGLPPHRLDPAMLRAALFEQGVILTAPGAGS